MKQSSPPAILTFMAVLVLAALAQAQTFTTLYNFTGGTDGSQPYAAVIRDAAGNLYGTTYGGGGDLGGVVFKVDTAGTETVLHNFTGNPDGAQPYTPLIRDSKGNIFGTTSAGGSNCGVVFRVDSAGTETVLHSFSCGTSDGDYPYQGVILDKAGNLYGTTFYGGSSGKGTIFKIDTAGNETILHGFAGGSSDGEFPTYGRLLRDNAGNLYGVTPQGGSSADGVVYKLNEQGKLTVLHSFAGGSDGCWPDGSVTMDKTGNLYGTTNYCGSSYGTVWRLSKRGKKTVLHNFTGGTLDGAIPYAGVTRDSKGNLYGVTYFGGSSGDGTVWKLSAKGAFALLQSFDWSDGGYPVGELLRTAQGELFGTTQGGGKDGDGTVWSYVP